MTDEKTKARRRDLVRGTLKQEDLSAIGEVAVRASVLDHMIEVTLEAIARGFPATIRRRALSLSAPQMLDAVIETLQSNMPEFADQIAAMGADISKARERRHAIVHSVWMPTDDADNKLLLDPREWKNKEASAVSVKEMLALADTLIDLTFEIGDWKTLRRRQNLAKEDKRVPEPRPPR